VRRKGVGAAACKEEGVGSFQPIEKLKSDYPQVRSLQIQFFELGVLNTSWGKCKII
jgi:hypothetical protein